MRRSVQVISGLLLMLLLTSPGWAQGRHVLPSAGSAAGSGVSEWGAADCTTITSPVSGSTWCFDTTNQRLRVWDTSGRWRDVSFQLVGTGAFFDDVGAAAAGNNAIVFRTTNVDGSTTPIEALHIWNTGILTTAGGNSPIGAIRGAIEAHINTGSSPGAFLCANEAARALSVGCAVSVYVGGVQAGNLFWQTRDATDNNSSFTIGLNTTAGVTNQIFTAIKDGSAAGTALNRFGASTSTPLNALEVENSLGPCLMLKTTGTAGTAKLCNDGTGSFYLSTSGAATPIILRINNVEVWRIGPAGGFFSLGATGGDKGAGTINAATDYYINGTVGLTVTKTVRAAGGAADCTLIFTSGLLTGGTC